MIEDLYFHREYALTDADGGRHRFGTKIRATEETIDEIVEARNMGEVRERYDPRPTTKPPPEKSLADLIEDGGFTVDALHMACFVSFMALKSGAATVESVLGDCGLIHEIVHNMAFGEGREPVVATRGEVARMAREIERAIPGYPYR